MQRVGKVLLLRFWNISSTSLSLTHIVSQLHKRSIRSIDFSPDGRYLAQASFDGSTSVISLEYSAEEGKPVVMEHHLITLLEGHENEVPFYLSY